MSKREPKPKEEDEWEKIIKKQKKAGQNGQHEFVYISDSDEEEDILVNGKILLA
jgi:hypothetical protein